MAEQILLPGLMPGVAFETDEDGVTRLVGVKIGVRREDGGFMPAKLTSWPEQAMTRSGAAALGFEGEVMQDMLPHLADAFGTRTKFAPASGKLGIMTTIAIRCGGAMVKTSTSVLSYRMDFEDPHREKLSAYVRIAGHLGAFVRVDLGMEMVKILLVDLSRIPKGVLKDCEPTAVVKRFARKFGNQKWTEIEA